MKKEKNNVGVDNFMIVTYRKENMGEKARRERKESFAKVENPIEWTAANVR
jgi:hypothetical protein